jgi:4-amino-4-deoxy-L-arabinose transferase-like glycosyltransferase
MTCCRVVPLLIIIVLGAALRFYGIGHQGIWYDESYTFALVKLPLGVMFGRIPHTESTPPLYYCFVWVWSRIFGSGAAGVRTFSAVCGTATIPVAYATARKLLHGKRAALITAALTAFNPLLIWYSQEARSYELLVLLSACTLLTFAYARERPRPLALALWAFACCCAITTHYYAILVVAPEAAWLVYEHRYRRLVYAAIGAIAVVGLALLPLIHAQDGNHMNDWIGRSPFGERLAQVIPIFLIGPQTPARTPLKFLAFAVALVTLALLWFASRRRERQGAFLAAGIAIAGFALSLLIVPVSDTFLARNLLALWLPAALVIAAGLGVARARLLGVVMTLVLCGIGATATIGVASNYYMQRPNWQRVAELLGPKPARGNRVILIFRNDGGPPLALYMAHLRYFGAQNKNAAKRADANLEDASETAVSEIDIISIRDIHHLGGFCWWGSACNLVPSKLSRSYRIRGFHVASRAHFEQFHILKLVSEQPKTVTRKSIARAVHHPQLLHDSLLLQS